MKGRQAITFYMECEKVDLCLNFRHDEKLWQPFAKFVAIKQKNNFLKI